MKSLPHRIPLTGGDYFALAIDREMRRAGMPGNICRLALKLDGHLEAERLRAALHASVTVSRLARVRLARRLPFMTPQWFLDGAPGDMPIGEHAQGTGALDEKGSCPLGSTWEALPPSAVGRSLWPFRAPGFAFDIVRHPDRTTTLVFSWHHAFMDARGAELLLRHIDRCNRGGTPSENGVFADGQVASRWKLREWLRVPASLRFAKESVSVVSEAGRAPMACLACNGRKEHGRCNLCRVLTFTEDETKLIEANGDRAGASFRRSLFCLAATVRAVHALRLRRHDAPGGYVIPVPQDTRRRGSAGPLLSNQVTFLFYRAEPEDVASMRKLVAALSQQMMDQMRRGVPRSFSTMMQISRNLPLPLYLRLMHAPSQGRVATFFFSDTGHSSLDLEDFLGLRIAGLAHLPPVPFPPGIAVVFGRFQGRLYSVISWVAGCLDSQEQDLLEQALRAELLTGGAP
jgi:hypothetical protein